MDGGVEVARMPPPYRGGWRCGASQDDANHQHPQPGAAEDRDGELTRRTPAIYFGILELEDGGVALVGDTADVYFVKLEPGGTEAHKDAASMPQWMGGAC